MADLVHIHIRLTPEAARAWGDAARQAGASITGLAEAVGQQKIRALGRDDTIRTVARRVDDERKRRPGPRPGARRQLDMTTLNNGGTR